MIDQIKTECKKITNLTPQKQSKALKEHPWLLVELKNLFGDKPNNELLYLGVNPETKTTCELGKKLKFVDKIKGYRNFCSPTSECICYKEFAKNNRIKSYNNFSEEQKNNRLKKFKETCLFKWGVDNPTKNQEIIKKQKNTNLERWGVENIFLLPENQIKKNNTNSNDKRKKTIREKYGVEHQLQSPEIQEKIKNTNLEKWGVEYTLQSPEIQEKIKNTNLEKWGVEYTLQSPEIQEKIKNTNLEKWGVHNHTQKHFTEETIKILNDKDNLHQLAITNGISSVSHDLNVDRTTIVKYLDIHGYDLNQYKNSTYIEAKIKSFLDDRNIPYEQNTRKIIPPLEIDFYLPENNIGIELNGLYWHSEKQNKNTKYHYEKYLAGANKGIQILQFWENEIRDNFGVIERMLSYKLKLIKSNTGARKTDLNEISSKLCEDFLNRNHIQGSTPQQGIRIGAWINLDLVGVMTFQPKKEGYELTRFSVDRPIPGVFSKMLKYFIKRYNPKWIQSFSDNRISNGDVYLKNGFTFNRELPETYFYTDYNNIFHRFNFRKKLIEKRFGIDMSNKTEKQAMIELGYDRIWDAGKKEWLIRL